MKTVEAVSLDDINETVSSRYNRTGTHKNSQRLQQQAQGLHRIKPVRVQYWEEDMDKGVLRKNKNLFTIDSHWQRKK